MVDTLVKTTVPSRQSMSLAAFTPVDFLCTQQSAKIIKVKGMEPATP